MSKRKPQGPHELTITAPAVAFGREERPVAASALRGFPGGEVCDDLAEYLTGISTVVFGGRFDFVLEGDELKARFRFLVARVLEREEQVTLLTQLRGQITDGAGENPLEVAWNGGVFYLQARTAPLKVDYVPAPGARLPTQSPLFPLIARGDLAGLRAALARGEPLAVRDKNGRSPLYFALAERQYDIALHLVSLEPRPAADQASFIYAAHSHPTVALAFLRHGVEVNRRSPWGRTALGEAVDGEQVEVVRALLDAGADPNLEHEGNGGGWRPLHCLRHALGRHHEAVAVELARLLLSRGADPRLTDGSGRLPPFDTGVEFLHWGPGGPAGPERDTPEGLRRAVEAKALGEANLRLAAVLGHEASSAVSGQAPAEDLAATCALLDTRWAPGPPPADLAQLLAPPYGVWMCRPVLLRAAAAIVRAAAPRWYPAPAAQAAVRARFERAARQGHPEGVFASPDAYADEMYGPASHDRPLELGYLLNLLEPEQTMFKGIRGIAARLATIADLALPAIRRELIPWALGQGDPLAQ